MDAVRKIILVACFLAIALSLLDILYPSQRFKKQVHLIFSLVFVIGLLMPFFSGSLTFDFPDIQNEKAEQSFSVIQNGVQTDYASAVETNINQALSELLKKNQIPAKEISAKINIEPDNSISIIKVEVVPEIPTDGQKIQSLIQSEVGQKTDVVVRQGNSFED